MYVLVLGYSPNLVLGRWSIKELFFPQAVVPQRWANLYNC
jgi:hypothetical protein